MSRYRDLFSTYSIVAYDAETGQFGGAVQTHQVGVGRIIPTVVAGFGVIASQSLANLRFNAIAVSMLQESMSAEDIIKALVAGDSGAHRRQVAVVDEQGRAAAHTGVGCIQYAAHYVGEGFSVQANMMTRDTVITAMREAYETAEGDLAARMMAAMVAAQQEDGDIRGMQSSALKVVGGEKGSPAWRTVYDLRVDEHADPVGELARLVNIRHAQLVNERGYEALTTDNHEAALDLFSQARNLAPDQEELAYWQAITLANDHDEVETAAVILREALNAHERRDHWLDLTRRLADCTLMRLDAANALLAALSTDERHE